MSCAKAIYSILSNCPAVAGLVATRIYPQIAPEDEQIYPRLTYETDDLAETVASDGPIGLASETVKVSVETPSYGDLKSLSSAVRGALNGIKGTFAGVAIQGLFLTDETESQYTDDAGQESLIRVNEIEFQAWFEVTP